MKNKFVLIILIIILVGLFLWEIWPDRIEIIHLDFKKNRTNQLISTDCREVEFLLDKQWEIKYPHLITKNESGEISVALLGPSSGNSLLVAGDSECDIAIEVYLDVPDTVTSPGSRIIEPYHCGSPLRFEWEIQALDGDVSGIIWIYMIVKDNGGQLSRYPLFALPVELQINTLMGVSPRVLRIILFALIIISSGIYLLLKSIVENDII